MFTRYTGIAETVNHAVGRDSATLAKIAPRGDGTLQNVMAAIEEIVRIGLPVVLGLLLVILIISYADRHSRKRKPPGSAEFRTTRDGRRLPHGNGDHGDADDGDGGNGDGP